MRIRRAVLDAIVDHARREQPRECCGLLIGDDDAVLGSRPARNLRQSDVAYLVDPADHFAAMREARAAGLTVLGAYHSHPASAPVPSPTDIGEAIDSGFLYLIVSLRSSEPAVAAFRIQKGAFDEVPLVEQ